MEKPDKRPNTSKGKHWTLTKWPCDLWDGEGFMSYEHMEHVEYIIMGREFTKENKKLHLQCYVYFSKDKTFKTVKRWFGKCHIKLSKGTPLQNQVYCSKDGNFFQIGELPEAQSVKGNQKQKLDYDEAIRAAKEQRIDDIPATLMVRYYNTFKRIAEEYRPLPKELEWARGESPNLWIYGPPGTGKSHYVRRNDIYKGKLFVKPLNKWWDQYKDEEVVLIEDIDPYYASMLHHIKTWSDIYYARVEVKNGTRAIRPAILCITSNYSIEEIWPKKEDHEPIKDRFQEIHMTVRYVKPK